MKEINFIFLLCLFSLVTSAQQVNLIWANSQGGLNEDQGTAITEDLSGNFYVAGYVTSNNGEDIFIRKVDKTGAVIWAYSLGGQGKDRAIDVITDNNGFAYITGSFSDTVDFDYASGVTNLYSNGVEDVFLLKIDSLGNFQWARSIGGIWEDEGHSIACDDLGNVYLTGYFQGIADFDSGPIILNLFSSGSFDAFVQKLGSDGKIIWTRTMGGADSDQAQSIEVDHNSNLILTGYFQGTADFDPDTATVNLTSNGGLDCYVQKLDSSGNHIWVKSVGGAFHDSGVATVCDSMGNIYVAGNFQDTADFNPGPGTFLLSSNGMTDPFIQKLDENGNFIWARSIGGSLNDHASSIAISPFFQRLHLVGDFSGTVDFDPGSVTYNITANSDRDAYMLIMDNGGWFGHVISMGAMGAQQTLAKDIHIGDQENINITGSFEGSVDFDPNLSSYVLSANGAEDVFIQTLAPAALGLSDNTFFNEVMIYPNPTSDIINIDIGSIKDAKVKLFSSTGQLILEKKISGSVTSQIDLCSMPGFYILELVAEQLSVHFKIIKQ